MTIATVIVRPAGPPDAYALWLWANDPQTREASHGRPPISWRDHLAWLRRRLDHDGALVLLATDAEERPVGSVRFESEDGWATARLSYVVAPEVRGQGVARPLLRGGMAVLCAAHPAVRVRADVLPHNARSVAVFRALGWDEHAAGPDALHFWSSCPERDA